MSPEVLELLSTIAPIAFYCAVALVAFGVLIYKLITIWRKKKNGEDVTQDIEELSEQLSSILTKKVTKFAKKNNIAVDTTTAASVVKLASDEVLGNTSENVQSIEQKDTEKKI